MLNKIMSESEAESESGAPRINVYYIMLLGTAQILGAYSY